MNGKLNHMSARYDCAFVYNIIYLSFKEVVGWGVGIPQWMKPSPATNVAWIRVQESTHLVRGLSVLLVFSVFPRRFSPGSPVFPSTQKTVTPKSSTQSFTEKLN